MIAKNIHKVIKALHDGWCSKLRLIRIGLIFLTIPFYNKRAFLALIILINLTLIFIFLNELSRISTCVNIVLQLSDLFDV